MKRVRSCVQTVVFVILFAGCSGGAGAGPVLYDVSGNVALDGKPVSSGEILFRATDGKQQTAAGKIVDGKYSLRSEAGAKRVEISSMQKVEGKMAASGTPGEPSTTPLVEEAIPARYNSDSSLTETVKSDGKNQFDFKLKSAP